jgi:hypothetical protein
LRRGASRHVTLYESRATHMTGYTREAPGTEIGTNPCYRDALVELGCSLKPGGSQSAIVEILEEQKLQQGEQLEPAVID